MARRQTRGRFIRPAPRTKMWIGVGTGSTTLVGSSKQVIGILSGGALLLRPFTILRTRIEILFESDQAATSETAIGAYANIVVTDTAAALGATAVPDPSGITGDPEADWFVWQAMVVDFRHSTSAAFNSDAGHHYTIDSKAMRKVGPDDDVASVTSMETAPGAIITVQGRRLIQLH